MKLHRLLYGVFSGRSERLVSSLVPSFNQVPQSASALTNAYPGKHFKEPQHCRKNKTYSLPSCRQPAGKFPGAPSLRAALARSGARCLLQGRRTEAQSAARVHAVPLPAGRARSQGPRRDWALFAD